MTTTAPIPVAHNWKESRATVLEVEADAIQAAVIALEHINGMFETKNHASLISGTLDMLQVEEENRRKAMDALRDV